MESISKKTLWIIVVIGIIVIAVIVGYLIKQANRGKELLEGQNVPENISQETQEGLNSVNPGNNSTSSEVSQPLGIDQSGFGDLDSGIQQLDSDINKL